MNLRAPAILLASRHQGETGAIARLLTAEHGLVAAYVAGGRGRQMRAVMVPGNRVAAELTTRSANQLPFAAGSFNAVLAIDNAHFWADRPAALAQIRHVIDGAPASLVLALSPQSGGSARAVIRDLDTAAFEVDYDNESSDGFLIRATAI